MMTTEVNFQTKAMWFQTSKYRFIFFLSMHEEDIRGIRASNSVVKYS